MQVHQLTIDRLTPWYDVGEGRRRSRRSQSAAQSSRGRQAASGEERDRTAATTCRRSVEAEPHPSLVLLFIKRECRSLIFTENRPYAGWRWLGRRVGALPSTLRRGDARRSDGSPLPDTLDR